MEVNRHRKHFHSETYLKFIVIRLQRDKPNVIDMQDAKYILFFSGIKGLGRCFRIMDDDRSRSLDFQEFKKGVREYGLTLDIGEVQDMFTSFDRDGSGTIDFDEFLVKLRPPLSKSRQALIKKAFLKLDRTGKS